jgi:hypothetical protein
MGSPVKVADELIEEAKRTAALANRSIAKQIEHWARIGRAVELLATTDDVMSIKAQLADPGDSARTAAARAALERLVRALADRTDREAARKRIFSTGKPVYEAVPSRPDLVSEVRPDGGKKRGRLVEGNFVADTGKRRKARRSR